MGRGLRSQYGGKGRGRVRGIPEGGRERESGPDCMGKGGGVTGGVWG